MESEEKKAKVFELWKQYKATKSVELRNRLAEYYFEGKNRDRILNIIPDKIRGLLMGN